MKAVVWTDALQGVVYMAGIITVMSIVSRSTFLPTGYLGSTLEECKGIFIMLWFTEPPQTDNHA